MGRGPVGKAEKIQRPKRKEHLVISEKKKRVKERGTPDDPPQGL